MVLKKSSDFKFFPLILAENPMFFPDFTDWKKSSKSSLIGGNPASGNSNIICVLSKDYDNFCNV